MDQDTAAHDRTHRPTAPPTAPGPETGHPGHPGHPGPPSAPPTEAPTEAIRPDWAAIDELPTVDLLRLMNAEDRTVPAAVAAQVERIAAVVDAVAGRLAGGGRLVYAGAGTAGRLGVLDAAECPPTFGTDPALVVALIAGGRTAVTEAVEGAEDRPELAVADVAALALTPADTLVGVSASGRTPYAVAAVRAARATGALTVALACNPGSALAAAADLVVEVEVGPEVLAGSTRLKAGTAQKLVLNMLSTAVMVRLGRTYGNLMVDVRATNAKLRERARRIVAEATGADEAAVRRALTATDGRAKDAVLLLLADVDAPTASRLLTAADGRLREALRAARTG
ncbi:N-acetylmuramic acid 6-phosphate etherase [Kitasatospora sp. NPDC059599]|uniref:N-acetylmuramic acid 6-phosphate etherase n=1 Tax=Kitasatospora sp. NPDC059599 TaxID=3346880 RepID=UPI0036BA0E05